ncbi:MAG: sugar phosphate isomerase/epimerase [Bacteroidales bacterium]|nr:sugar phosphate isomerase/epimerase [Bacteroidales bacterium]
MRHRFLFALLVSVLLSGCSGSGDENRFRIGFQLYSVRQELRQDFYGTLVKVRDLGYEGVEFFDDYAGNTPERAREICDELGLAVFSNHFPYQRLVSDFDGVVRDAKVLGLEYITVPSLPARPGADPVGFETRVKAMEEFAGKARAAGFQLLYHNHEFEFANLPDGTLGYDRIFQSGSDVQAELDICWADYAGYDVPELLRRYSGRVPVLHIKDYSRDTEGTVGGRRVDFRPLGGGVMDLEAVLEAARENGVSWLCVEQDDPARGAADSFEGPAESARYLRERGLLRQR